MNEFDLDIDVFDWDLISYLEENFKVNWKTPKDYDICHKNLNGITENPKITLSFNDIRLITYSRYVVTFQWDNIVKITY